LAKGELCFAIDKRQKVSKTPKRMSPEKKLIRSCKRMTCPRGPTYAKSGRIASCLDKKKIERKTGVAPEDNNLLGEKKTPERPA